MSEVKRSLLRTFKNSDAFAPVPKAGAVEPSEESRLAILPNGEFELTIEENIDTIIDI